MLFGFVLLQMPTVVMVCFHISQTRNKDYMEKMASTFSLFSLFRHDIHTRVDRKKKPSSSPLLPLSGHGVFFYGISIRGFNLTMRFHSGLVTSSR